MTHFRFALACGAALAAMVSGSSFAQGSEGSCIVAGRLGTDGYWAPRFESVQLLGADGQALPGGGKQTLAAVRQVRLSAPALLSRCDGNAVLTPGPDSPGAKMPVPAVGPGVVTVESVSFPKLRTGGELVELKLAVPAERVVMLTR